MFILFGSFGCSVMSPERYSISPEISDILRDSEAKEGIVLSKLVMGTSFSRSCRLFTLIHAAPGREFNDYIKDAFNDEFRSAGIYNRKGVVLVGSIDKMDFSSTSFLTKGFWHITLTLKSENNHRLTTQITYYYNSGWNGISACDQATKAFRETVQDLIKQTVSHQNFDQLLNK